MIRRGCAVALAGLLLAVELAPAGSGVAAGPVPTSAVPLCVGSAPGAGPPVLLVHDFAATSASMARIARRIGGDGRCVVAIEHGTMPIVEGGALDLSGVVPGGLAGLEDSADEIRRAIRRVARSSASRRVDVVAVGAGSLAALRALQTARHPERVRRLVSVGSLWDGTNLLGLGDLEQQSRDAGTYDLVLPLEQLTMDGLCASCREMIHGSDFLRRLRAAGLEIREVRQLDIVTRTDGLVAPWTSGVRRRTPVRVVQDVNPDSRVNHLGLTSDPTVVALVARAVS